jgi:putative transposase
VKRKRFSRIREIAQTRVRYDYRKIRALLNREGWRVEKKLVYRLYREEGLTLRHKPRRKPRVSLHRQERFRPTGANQVWSLDFVADQLADGRQFRALRAECLDVHWFATLTEARQVIESWRREYDDSRASQISGRTNAE